ncbi:UNVERIFIED_CONTAM: hypothetical protein FKN15_068254 [Acipenser sinensis]
MQWSSHDQQYGLTPYQAVQSTKLRERRRQPGESLGRLGMTSKPCANKCTPTGHFPAETKPRWRSFIGAVTPAALREHLLLKEPRSVKKAIAEGRRLEQILETTRVAPRDYVAAATTNLGVAPSPIRRYQARPYTTYPDRRLCWHCNQPGHLQTWCPQLASPAEGTGPEVWVGLERGTLDCHPTPPHPSTLT